MTGLPRQIVGIGPGRGANFPYLDPGTRVIAFEPNLHRRRRPLERLGSNLDPTNLVYWGVAHR